MPPLVNEPTHAVRRSTRSHVQTPTPSGEVFDLNVSGSEDDNNAPAAQPAPTNAQPAPANAQPAPTNAQPVTPMNLSINNADVQDGRNYAADIRHFFKVTPTEKICKVCR